MWLSKTMKGSVNWFVHKKAMVDPAELFERLLQKNWTFFALLSSELQNTIFVWLNFPSVPGQVISDTIKQKRIERWRKLLRRLPKTDTKNVFHWLEKLLSQPSCKQSEQPCLACWEEAWGGRKFGLKSQVCAIRHVLAGVCFNGKGQLHFTTEKTKVNAKLYIDTLLPKLVADCKTFASRLHFLQ